jgi:DNA-binding transcriptional LysR family regulator
VAPFCDRHPAVSVDLQLDDRRIDLVEGGFDVGVRVTTELTRFSLRARRLADSRRVLCATPEYLEAHGTPLTPRDLGDHACINYTYLSTGNRWTFASSEGEQRVKVTGPVKSNSSIVIKDAVLGHQGIAQFPAFAVTGELSEGRLVSLLEDWPMPALHVFALYPETRHVPRKVRAFIDFLAERFGDVEW